MGIRSSKIAALVMPICVVDMGTTDVIMDVINPYYLLSLLVLKGFLPEELASEGQCFRPCGNAVRFGGSIIWSYEEKFCLFCSDIDRLQQTA
jgi:hypothetical protein